MNNENKVEEVVVVPSVESIPTLMEEKLKEALKEAQVVIESKKETNMEEKQTINETGRKIGQNIAVGLILAEKTVKTLIEKGKTKTKSTVEQGKSFISELIAGYKEIKDAMNVQK